MNERGWGERKRERIECPAAEEKKEAEMFLAAAATISGYVRARNAGDTERVS